MDTLPAITAVWSSFGHTFLSTGEYDESDNPYESCLTCGAEYVLRRRADNPTYGDYQANNGDDPLYCSGRPDLVHGYERVCQDDNGRECANNAENGTCTHVDHTCNCLQCD